MRVFAQLTKVDVERREAWGRAVEEIADKSGEIFDYASSAPLFRAWSGEIEKSTTAAGQEPSLGNVRAMHGKVAAGKVAAITFNDGDRAIDICAKVIDDNEWEKVKQGVYTGFSIGGDYAKRWRDGSLTRYTAKPSEISLVDNPCVPTATFSLVKAAGATEARPFKVAARSDTTPAEGEHKYGDVAFADAKNKKYPIDTAAHIRAAWNYIHKPANAGKYSAADVARIKAKIVAAWKKKIDPKGPPEAQKLAKGLYATGAMADLLERVTQLAADAEAEPQAFRDWLATGASVLEARVDAECAEWIDADDSDETPTTPEDAPMEPKAADAEVTKSTDAAEPVVAAAVATPDLTKLAERMDALQKQMTDLTAERDALKKRVADLEDEPEPAKGAVRVVEKAKDGAQVVKVAADADDDEDIDPKDPEIALKLMKRAHRNPQPMSLR